MSDLKLVPPHERTELERLLIEAAANEKPSEEHKLRVREALGLAVPLSIPPPMPGGAEATVASTSAGSSSAGAAAGASSSAGAAAGASSSAGAAALVKVLAGGLASAGALGAVVFALVAPERSEPEPTPVRAPAAVVERAEPVTPPTVAAEPTVELEVAAPPDPAPAVKAEPRVKPAREPKSASEDDLRQQIVLIEAARAHVAQNNPWPALQALDEYATRFKGGSFNQEAAVLRMKAVAQAGDRERAASLARSFLEKNPTSPHVERVRRIAEPAESR